MCFIRQEGKTLMLQKRHGPLKGQWLTIGGHFEPGETPDECVRREAKEEAGLELEEIYLRGIITFVVKPPDGQIVTNYAFVYECHCFTGVAMSFAEGEVKWVPDYKLSELDIPKKDQILPLIYNNRHLFSAKCISSEGVIKAENVDYYNLLSQY
jgi:8-oxo-dGTP diphosphatase